MSGKRIEISRISGDIYINGTKRIFAADFNNPPSAEPEYKQVDWLIGWAKIGLMSRGHDVPHFEARSTDEFDAEAQ